MKTLKVFAQGTFMVPDFEAMEQGKLRFVGRTHDATIGVNGGWIPRLEPVTIKYRAEYIQELRAGTLLPADKETAQFAKVTFIPVKF